MNIYELKRYRAFPKVLKYHPSTNQYEYKNDEIPKVGGVYFIFNKNDEIVYIGTSSNIQKRIASHLGKNKNKYAGITNKDDIQMISFIESYKLLQDRHIVERFYIDKYKPKYNDVHIETLPLMTVEEIREAMKNVPML